MFLEAAAVCFFGFFRAEEIALCTMTSFDKTPVYNIWLHEELNQALFFLFKMVSKSAFALRARHAFQAL